MNALTLLKRDHRTVEALFKGFERAKGGAAKKRLVAKIVHELSIHASIEEQIFYPAIRKGAPKTEDMVLEALEEHHIVKWTLAELSKMGPDAERYDAKVTVLMESVRHHVKEEEHDLFPKVKKAMDAKALVALGAALEQGKKRAPTRPHPRAPDVPTGNKVAALGTAMLDRARDAVAAMGKRGAAKKKQNHASAKRRAATKVRAKARR